MAKIETVWFLKDLDEDRILRISNGTTFGRNKGEYTFPNSPRMSSIHCEFSVDDGILTVMDLESHNGTFVNSMRCIANRKMALDEKSILMLGDKNFSVYSKQMEVRKK